MKYNHMKRLMIDNKHKYQLLKQFERMLTELDYNMRGGNKKNDIIYKLKDIVNKSNLEKSKKYANMNIDQINESIFDIDDTSNINNITEEHSIIALNSVISMIELVLKKLEEFPQSKKYLIYEQHGHGTGYIKRNFKINDDNSIVYSGSWIIDFFNAMPGIISYTSIHKDSLKDRVPEEANFFEHLFDLTNPSSELFWFYIVKSGYDNIPLNHGRDFIYNEIVTHLSKLDNTTQFRILLLPNEEMFNYINNIDAVIKTRDQEVIEKNNLIIDLNASIYNTVTCTGPCVKQGLLHHQKCNGLVFDPRTNIYIHKQIDCTNAQ